MPATRRATVSSAAISLVRTAVATRVSTGLPRESNGRPAAPEHQREEEVDKEDERHRQPDRPSDGAAHALGTTRRVEPVRTVDGRHQGDEDDDLHNTEEDVGSLEV